MIVLIEEHILHTRHDLHGTEFPHNPDASFERALITNNLLFQLTDLVKGTTVHRSNPASLQRRPPTSTD